MLKSKIILCFFLVFCFSSFIKAQDNLYTSYTTETGRAKLYNNLVKTSITKNLSMPLTDSAEENWEEAFSALELLEYRSPWVDNRINSAFDSIDNRSAYFQKALMEIIYANYPENFAEQVTHLLNTTIDERTFSISAEYLLRLAHDESTCNFITSLAQTKFSSKYATSAVLEMLQKQIEEYTHSLKSSNIHLADILSKNFLPGEIVMYSFQRKNRDYPGLAIVRNKQGLFVKDSSGKFFYVSQLARSINNLPCYLSNGNTPQGLYK